MKALHVVRAFSLTLFLFGLLTWLYVIAIQITHPRLLPAQPSHIQLFPLNARVDVVGIVGFIVSGLSFFPWQLTSPKSARQQ
jgi:hypothetical protein